MFTRKEERMFHDGYFSVIRETELFVEVRSENTGHYWNVFKNSLEASKRVTLYHKHKATDKYYHRHRECRTVQEAIEQIKSHDHYILEQQSQKQEKRKAPEASRRLKVYGRSGYKYQPTPTIQLKGKWLEEYGFPIGTELNVACADGILTITRA